MARWSLQLRLSGMEVWAFVVTGAKQNDTALRPERHNETEVEATHLRLSGPQKAVEKHYPAFEKWLKSIK